MPVVIDEPVYLVKLLSNDTYSATIQIPVKILMATIIIDKEEVTYDSA